MALPVELHEAAELELWEAIDWYDQQKPDLGKEFARELERVVEAIGFSPNRFPAIFGDARRAVLQRFPYVVIFEVQNDVILILAIFHTSRQPKHWQKRT
jgi:toxin ParE1/3/4